MTQVVILAGGMGKRLRQASGDIPKAMVPVNGEPVLTHQLALCRKYGLKEVLLLTGFRGEVIESYYGCGSDHGVSLTYLREQEPLGTAGAVLAAADRLTGTFLVMYGDTILNVDLSRFLNYHTRQKSGVSLFLHPNNHPSDSDLVRLDETGLVSHFYAYPHEENVFLPNLVNAALYVMEASALSRWRDCSFKGDLCKKLFPEMKAAGVRFAGYVSHEYIKDMGTPERLKQVESDMTSGKVGRASFEHKQAAVFLDRDGTLTQQLSDVKTEHELVLLPMAAEALRTLNRSFYLPVLITNQPLIAKGFADFATLERIHNKLETELGREGAFLDRIYFCPHHPEQGFPGERPELKRICSCRKPAPGMVLQAASEMNLDLDHSWFIGDTTTDLATALTSGLSSILVGTGNRGADHKYPFLPDFQAADVARAAQFIVMDYPMLRDLTEPLLKKVKAGSIIAIAGLSHSGKSTLASVLCRQLRQVGKRAVVLCLDGWRKPMEQWGDTLLENFDEPSFNVFLETIANLSATKSLAFPVYMPEQDRVIKDRYHMDVDSETVLICEGLPALLFGVLQSVELRLYVSVDVATRRRLLEEQLGRNLDETSRTLFQSREALVCSQIKASSRIATNTFQLVPEN